VTRRADEVRHKARFSARCTSALFAPSESNTHVYAAILPNDPLEVLIGGWLTRTVSNPGRSAVGRFSLSLVRQFQDTADATARYLLPATSATRAVFFSPSVRMTAKRASVRSGSEGRDIQMIPRGRPGEVFCAH